MVDSVESVLKNTVPISSSLIKRSTLLKFQYDVELNAPELEVFLKIALQNGLFAYDSHKLASCRVHPTSSTSSGIRVDRLVRNLIEITVDSQYEKSKYKFISNRMISAINVALRNGDKGLAKLLLRGKYYPKHKLHYKIIQKILLLCPTKIIQKII